ncbi:unnamed protein product [Cuscuta epithymum]|uniref:Uncharacterized protein n=1 Tax=Cuscuta epithymum TaxID=186058 RepID=A0AAV0EEB3_9ASTE|nr:unnamed protein product [Cuscuta epithymum]
MAIRASKILRRSIFTFLQNYQYFTTTAAFLAFPFAASLLLLRSSFLIPAASSSSSFLRLIHARIHSLFHAAGFPPSSILEAKISQTISISLLAVPFTISSYLFSKASVIYALRDQERPKNPSFSGVFEIYRPLIHTHICNSFLTLAANATCFSLMFIAVNLANGLGFSSSLGRDIVLSATGAVGFSIVLANSFIICNLALIISGMEKNGGMIAALKACSVMVKGRRSCIVPTALSLAVQVNAALAAVEVLFQYRVVLRAYDDDEGSGVLYVALEGMFIAYLYAVLLVLDTIVGCFFFTDCHRIIQDGKRLSKPFLDEIDYQEYNDC